MLFITRFSSSLVPNKIMYLGKNTELSNNIAKKLIIKNKESFVQQNKKELVQINNFQEVDTVIVEDIRDYDINELIDDMKKNNISKLFTFSKSNGIDKKVDLMSLCGSEIDWCDICINKIALKESTENVQINQGKTSDFLKSEISLDDLTMFCTEILLDEKNPYINERIYIQESKKSIDELVNDVDNDIIYKLSNWIGLFPPEKKWKNIRFMFYSFMVGFVLSDQVDKIIHTIFNPDIKDFWG